MAEALQDELIKFMFRRDSDGGLDVMQCLNLWFGKSNDTDIEIECRFGDHVANALNGGFLDWQKTARGCLALMILIDQFPRNIYRHTVRSFAGDALSRQIVYSTGHDWLSVLKPEECIFVPCLIMTHQENLKDQEFGLKFYDNLEPSLPSQLHIFRTIFEEHHRIIALCGTFPHRDHYYNRQTSAVGKQLLDNSTLRFDLPLCPGADGTVRFGHDPIKLWQSTQKAFDVVDRIDTIIDRSARPRSTVKTEHLTPKGQAEVAEIFKVFDKDGSGFLEISELAIALDAAGHRYSASQLQEAVDTATGCKNSLGLTFEQFADLLRSSLTMSLESRMARRFELFDNDQSGEVDLEEFTACIQGFDNLITTAEAAAMFQQCDCDGNGRLSLQEFIGVLQRKCGMVDVDLEAAVETQRPEIESVSVAPPKVAAYASEKESVAVSNTSISELGKQEAGIHVSEIQPSGLADT